MPAPKAQKDSVGEAGARCQSPPCSVWAGDAALHCTLVGVSYTFLLGCDNLLLLAGYSHVVSFWHIPYQ